MYVRNDAQVHDIVAVVVAMKVKVAQHVRASSATRVLRMIAVRECVRACVRDCEYRAECDSCFAHSGVSLIMLGAVTFHCNHMAHMAAYTYMR